MVQICFQARLEMRRSALDFPEDHFFAIIWKSTVALILKKDE